MSGELHSCRLRELIRRELTRYSLRKDGDLWRIMSGSKPLAVAYVNRRDAEYEMRNRLADRIATEVQWYNGIAFGALVFQAQDFMADDPVRHEQHQRAKTALETGEVSWPAD